MRRVITSPATASVVVGTPFAYTITASGSPTVFTASGLPPGLTFNNGAISGTPTLIGTYNVQLGATNASGTGYGNLAMTVKLPLPGIISAATADGLVNTPFAYTIQAANLATIFGTSGLPGGLVLNPATGNITGTPTNAGTFAVTISATNTTGSATAPLTIVIYSATASLPGITSSPVWLRRSSGAVRTGSSICAPVAAARGPTSSRPSAWPGWTCRSA